MNLLPSLLALYNLLALCAQSASTSDAIRDSYQVQLLTLDKEVGTLPVHLEGFIPSKLFNRGRFGGPKVDPTEALGARDWSLSLTGKILRHFLQIQMAFYYKL